MDSHPLRAPCPVASRHVHLVADVGGHRCPRRWQPAQHHVAALLGPARQQSRRGVQEHCRK